MQENNYRSKANKIEWKHTKICMVTACLRYLYDSKELNVSIMVKTTPWRNFNTIDTIVLIQQSTILDNTSDPLTQLFLPSNKHKNNKDPQTHNKKHIFLN